MRKILIFSSVCLIILTFLIYRNTANNFSIHKRIATIPQNDRVLLENFFRFLYSQGHFVDVIYGDKPMTSVDYNENYTLNVSKDKTYKENMTLCLRGWKAWKKYQHLFPMKKYHFFSKKFSNGDTCYCYVLINKEKCSEVIDSYKEIFSNFIAHKKSLTEIIENLYISRPEREEDLTKYHHSHGLLYGYGEKNVKTFLKIIDLENTLSHHNNLPDTKIASLKKELDSLRKNACFTKSSKNPKYPIQHSGCITLTPDEKIVNHCKTHKEILEVYKSKDFLQILLEELTTQKNNEYALNIKLNSRNKNISAIREPEDTTIGLNKHQ